MTLLTTQLDEFDCNLLKLAFKGKCMRFISTGTVQKCALVMWKNSNYKDTNALISANHSSLEVGFLKKILYF